MNESMRARAQLLELAQQLRDDLGRLPDPSTRTLFATTADLLVTLEEAFADAELRSTRWDAARAASVAGGKSPVS